jgi:hypothetical protein
MMITVTELAMAAVSSVLATFTPPDGAATAEGMGRVTSARVPSAALAAVIPAVMLAGVTAEAEAWTVA